MTNIVFLIALGCALVYLPLTARPASALRTVFKTTSVAALAVAALVQGGPWLLVVALILCATGDALLSRETDATFMVGIASFAGGHLAYIALFLTYPTSNADLIWNAPATVWSLIILGIVMATLLAPRAADLKGPVLAYIPIILGMGIAVMALPETGVLRRAFPAAIAFIASDLILATEKFLLPPNHPALKATPYLIWPLYWGAQLGFVLAFA
ncbi:MULTISPECIES: lysoplasmalogenase [unclassified Ruegeria]|uniref:lysoplasmalogenase n=1 Tax=unclassified Ruegeria TaxID=2625375 RepID=UPI001489585E|nr:MULTISPECIES: lysoplasmalogenase [unclassified Ruegeria]NOD75036.1 lysoplasmalogenase [Ruegeria sp. HKCCD4332]NOD86997.1 lysoplasmalogenase [Ruegeria sp. HKCCD4318]NOE12552.1 lysoplasmalogenase [Ruegeria sp. HKCCD4318-2]NOG09283.1 lysoplasmalogenase [Ruegeria sp. HKCCD4315]